MSLGYSDEQREKMKLAPPTNRDGFPRCKECGVGYYGCVMTYSSCDNPQCKLYKAFNMAKCGICGQERRRCCC
jgi:hypothetical protein